MPKQNVIKHDTSEKKGMLSCCKCLPENLQNVHKMPCWQKALGVYGLTLLPNAY